MRYTANCANSISHFDSVSPGRGARHDYLCAVSFIKRQKMKKTRLIYEARGESFSFTFTDATSTLCWRAYNSASVSKNICAFIIRIPPAFIESFRLQNLYLNIKLCVLTKQ